MKKVVIIAAHPDDETLGCGGTIARHNKAGDHVQIWHLSNGCQKKKDIQPREKNAMSAMRILLGSPDNNYETGEQFSDQRFDSVDLLDIVKDLERDIYKYNPDIIYTHWIGDLNKDHEITARAVLTACRPLPNCSVTEIYGFEVLSSTEWAPVNPFVPDHYVEIDYSIKRKALLCYKEEMRDSPHARSYEAAFSQASLRGAQCGVDRKVRRI